MLGNRWAASSVAAGVSVSASSGLPKDNQTRPHLETIWYSIRNLAGAGVNHTVSAQVRHAGGTVVMSVEHFLAASTVANVNLQAVGVAGKRGGSLTVAMNTAVASVTYAVNAAGWFEDVNG
jgi:hypothetical protein